MLNWVTESNLVSDFKVLTNHLCDGHLTVQVVDQVLQWGECLYPFTIFGDWISNTELTWSRFKCEQNCSYPPVG